jgi:microcystin-dependent protein
MTFVSIPNRPLGTDVRSIEMILADFDAITSVINGGLDQSNMSSLGQQSGLVPGDLVVSAAPGRSGCLLCDGSAVSRTIYAALWAAIGGYFGNGDGSSTFNIPDYRGRVIMGAGAGPGLTGRSLGQEIGAETQAHNVPQLSIPALSVNSHTHPLGGSGGAAISIAWGTNTLTVYDTPNGALGYNAGHGHVTGTGGYDGGSTAVNPAVLIGNTEAAGGSTVGSATGTGITDYQNIVQPSTVANVFIKT